MSISTSVAIVIPMYNESRRLETSFRAISSFVERRPWVSRLILVDDGSVDGTASTARRVAGDLPVELVSYFPNAGKGYAIRRGVLETEEEAVLLSDADLSTPLEELDGLLPLLHRWDVVIGSRGIDPTTVRVRQPWYRQTMGRIFNRFVRLITGLPFHDTQCGFKLFRGTVAREVFREAVVDRFAYDVEAITLALAMGHSVCEIPVPWYDRAGSRVTIGRDSTRMLIDLFRIRRRLGAAPVARTAILPEQHRDDRQEETPR